MFEKIQKKIDFEKLTYCFFIIYTCFVVFEATIYPLISDEIEIICKTIKYGCFMIFVIKILYDIYQEKKLNINILIIAVLSIIIFLFSKNKSIIEITILLISLRKMNYNKLIKLALRVFIVIFAVIINLSLLGLIPDWTYTRGETIRHSLGFLYPTDCIGIFFSIILMIFYIKKSNITVWEILFLQTVNTFLYKYTDGRMSFILATILLLTMLISKRKIIKKFLYDNEIVQKILSVICYITPITLFILFNLIVLLYTDRNAFSIKINNLLSGRIEYTYNAYQNYGVPIFGKDIEWMGWGGHGYTDSKDASNFKYNFVDSSYAKMIFDYGILFTMLVILSYTKILVIKNKEKDYWTVITLIYILIWSFIEPYLINFGRNPLVLLLIPLINLGKNINLNIRKENK